MKKFNNKGFMMAELLVVAVVVLVIFTVLFTNFIPTKGEYEKRLEYNDIDTLYGNYYLKVLLLRHYSSPTKVKPTLNNGFLTIVENNTCVSNYSYNGITCQQIVDKYNISDAVITNYKPTSYNGPLKEYINYLDIEDSGELFRITTKTNKGYSSDKFYSKICGEAKYSNWSSYTIKECAGPDEVCEKSTKKVNIYNNGTAKPTNCDKNPLCYLSNGNYYIINYPCDNDCTDMILYRTRQKFIAENEKDNFSISPHLIKLLQNTLII